MDADEREWIKTKAKAGIDLSFICVHSRLFAAFFCLWVLLGVGCKPPGPIVPGNLNPAPIDTRAQLPAYGDLVRRYNANAATLERVFARTDVEMRWRDAKGRQRSESGDGRLIFERPLNTAWTIEKFSDIKLWAGSNAQGFWMFDELEDNVAYYGSYGAPLARPLPLPVSPESVPYLLGLMPIDPDKQPAPPEVERIDGYLVIEPPGLGLRLMLHPQTARPVRIDLTADDGRSVVMCVLSGETPVRVDADRSVMLPAKAEIYIEGEESRMTVELRDATTDGDKIQERYFDFDALVKALKPEKVVNLNAF